MASSFFLGCPAFVLKRMQQHLMSKTFCAHTIMPFLMGIHRKNIAPQHNAKYAIQTTRKSIKRVLQIQYAPAVTNISTWWHQGAPRHLIQSYQCRHITYASSTLYVNVVCVCLRVCVVVKCGARHSCQQVQDYNSPLLVASSRNSFIHFPTVYR